MDDERSLTVDELLALHPWPPGQEGGPRLERFWSVDVPLPPEDVWRIVADSSRLNRKLGLGEMKFEDRGAVRWGSARTGGIRHEWIEVPWSWVAGQWITSVRLYERGFSRATYAIFRIEPTGSGRSSRLHTYLGAVPRGFFGGLALRIGLPGLERSFRKFWGEVASAQGHAYQNLLAAAAPELHPDADARLGAIRDRLHEGGLDRTAVDRLVEWIKKGDDEDLQRIQVRERARAWSVDEHELLRVFLHATRAGMLDLSWDVVCPHCRGVAGATGVLGELPASGSCDSCQIDFATSGDQAVEITFHVHPSIREVPRRMFCSAEASSKDHIRVQRTVLPGAVSEVSPALAAGRYRLRLQSEKRYGYLDVGTGTAAAIDWSARAEPDERASGPAPMLRLVNDGDEAQTFVVEVAQWSDIALRPGRLLSFQEFRDLFSDEYLGADVQLSIGEQTILFTDMVGSTALYAERGDPAAFVEVKRHFKDVFAILEKHRGALVKTIGDAAMGAFNNPLDAVKASKAIQDCFHAGREDSLARLRISLNTGPCIAVRLNTDIDYFGHTVNVAAKLQATAESWQISMSKAVYDAPGVAAWLAEQGAPLEDMAYSSKAIREPIAVKRWTVYPPEGSMRPPPNLA
jgi:class 3 adenylate cyclase